jgi:hypothetical protein
MGEVLKVMLLGKLKIATAMLLGCFVLAAVGVGLSYSAKSEGRYQEKKDEKPAQQDSGAVAKVGGPLDRKALRERGVDNMKKIASALHDYHSAHGSFPPAVLHTPEGKPSYSWRVAILPYMSQKEKDLYKQYNFDEPWDGPNNRKLLSQIPSAFHLPDPDQDETHASYFALTGPGAVFSGDKGTSLDEIRDGASTTILFVEWKRAVPWTKPEDIPITADDPLAKIGGYFETCARMGGFEVAFADSSIKLISGTMNDSVLRALITKAGGEKISIP